MYTINLLILIGIICAYLCIGAGIYMGSCLIFEYPIDDGFTAVSMVFWPIILLVIIPLIMLKTLRTIWIFFKSVYIQEGKQ